MFTGLVMDLGEVEALEAGGDGVRMRVRTTLAPEIAPGDSVAVNGVCLTATDVEEDGFAADVMRETLRRSSLGAVGAGGQVNVELPLRPADRLGGHFVQGHVDGTGRVTAVEEDGFARRVRVEPEDEGLLRYVVEKGSIAVDGVSLTVASLDERGFVVSLIPETLERTNLGAAASGTTVNLEVDVLAKYVERLVAR
ncbi:MAG TPA: riboflavin synthase [Solirubrobacteraceae bacterium]|nr:riboflavin synthase [Solirubrobacteraceae bacterium]